MFVSVPIVTCCLERIYTDVCLCTKCHVVPKTQLYWCLSLYQLSPAAQNAAILMSVSVACVTCCLKRSYIYVCLCTKCHLLPETELYWCLCLYQVSHAAWNSAILMSVSVSSVTWCLKRSYSDVCLCTKCHLMPQSQLYWCLFLYQVSPAA